MKYPSRVPPRTALLLALAAPLLSLAPAHAQPAATGPSEATATAATPVILDAERALLLAFGNQEGLARLSDRVVERLRAEGRIGQVAPGSPPARLKQQLADRFCQAFEGRCEAQRAPAATARADAADLPGPRADLSALADVLREAMDAQAVPVAAQDTLLARLAPEQRRVVSR